MVPHGYSVTFGNNDVVPAWLVMRWGQILQVCDSFPEACAWLQEKLEEEGSGGGVS